MHSFIKRKTHLAVFFFLWLLMTWQVNKDLNVTNFQGWEETFVCQRCSGRRICCHVLHRVRYSKSKKDFLYPFFNALSAKLSCFCLCFSAGRSFISDEELRPERSASIQRANSFTNLNNLTRMWITNRMLFDHPLYGLNIDRVLGFHEYTLGQVTIYNIFHLYQYY